MSAGSQRRRAGRPKGGGGAKAREAIEAAAVELFAACGFTATSMARIADSAGISQTGLAHHFPTKLDLLFHVLTVRDRQDHWLLNGEGMSSGWEHFDRLGKLIELNSTRPGMVKLFTSVAGEAATPGHPAHDWFAGHYRQFHQGLEEALLHGIKDGTVRPETPVREISRLTAAVIDGLQVQWLNDPTLNMAQDFRVFVASLRHRWELP